LWLIFLWMMAGRRYILICFLQIPICSSLTFWIVHSFSVLGRWHSVLYHVLNTCRSCGTYSLSRLPSCCTVSPHYCFSAVLTSLSSRSFCSTLQVCLDFHNPFFSMLHLIYSFIHLLVLRV
jgi:hypothetical protein